MLARMGERAPLAAQALSEELKIPLARLEGPLAALCERGIVEREASANFRLTAQGIVMRERLLKARRKGLAEMMARWEPDKHPDVLAMFNGMVDTLVRDLPAPVQLHAKPA